MCCCRGDGLAGLGLFTAFGPPGLYRQVRKSGVLRQLSRPQPEYENWFHSGAHHNIKCIDCHLPNDNLRPPFMEGRRRVGRFVAFHTGRVPETIKISDHRGPNGGDQLPALPCRDSWPGSMKTGGAGICHRRMSHRSTGAIATCPTAPNIRREGMKRIRPIREPGRWRWLGCCGFDRLFARPRPSR